MQEVNVAVKDPPDHLVLEVLMAIPVLLDLLVQWVSQALPAFLEHLVLKAIWVILDPREIKVCRDLVEKQVVQDQQVKMFSFS